MNPSDEVKNAVLRLYESMSIGDVSAIERLFSIKAAFSPSALTQNEWWAGYDTIDRSSRRNSRGEPRNQP